MTARQTYCCAGYADKPEAALSLELFAIAEGWYAEHPIAVGSGSRGVKTHQRECQDAVRAYYTANRSAIEQRCGFFEPLTVISIILTIIRLFYDWTHRADISQEK